MLLKRLILTLALMIGAFVMAPAATQAAPLGASAQAEQAAPTNVQKAQFYYYRRYRPRYRYYRRYYRPRYYYYRPRRYYYYRRW